MRREERSNQVEQSFASLCSVLVAADDVVMHVETALVAHSTRFLSARRTIPLSLGNALHMASSPMTHLQIYAVQMEGQRTSVAADEISSLSAHMAAIIPFIGHLSLFIGIIVGSFRGRFFGRFFARFFGGLRRRRIGGIIIAGTPGVSTLSLHRSPRRSALPHTPLLWFRRCIG